MKYFALQFWIVKYHRMFFESHTILFTNLIAESASKPLTVTWLSLAIAHAISWRQFTVQSSLDRIDLNCSNEHAIGGIRDLVMYSRIQIFNACSSLSLNSLPMNFFFFLDLGVFTFLVGVYNFFSFEFRKFEVKNISQLLGTCDRSVRTAVLKDQIIAKIILIL